MAKLTLNVEFEVIAEAKRLAAEWGTSVSGCSPGSSRPWQTDASRPPLGRLTRQASGVIDLEGRDYKDVLAEGLQYKYGL